MPGRTPLPPTGLIALVAAVTLVPLAAVGWFGWRALEQDEAALERQHVVAGADAVVSALERALASAADRLATGNTNWPEGAVVLTVTGTHADVMPRRRVAFLPAPPAALAPAGAVFDAAETLEYQGNTHAAIALYRAATASRDRAVRAGALVRLARAERREGRTDAALAAYGALLEIDDVGIDDVPAALVGRYGRCRLLDDAGRVTELAAEAVRLQHDLTTARWPLGAAVYRLYAADAARWTNAADAAPSLPERLAEAAALVHARLAGPSAADSRVGWREVVSTGTETFTVLVRRHDAGVRALVAAESFVTAEWLTPALVAGRDRGVVAAIGRPVRPAARSAAAESTLVVRTAGETGLPWDVSVLPAGSSAALPGLVSRRRLFIVGFGLLVAMTLTAGYAVVRAVGREIRAARQQSDFLAAVSHEFRTPLTTLRQFTDRLREHPDMPAGSRLVCVDAQSRATDRLTRLVESLLDVGRMDAGAQPYAFVTCDATEIVREVVADVRQDAAAAGHEVRVRAAAPVLVQADRSALGRAVWNLIDNAVKYSPGQPLVEIEVYSDNGEARIAVRDRGIGIPPPELADVVRKFRRGAEARARGISGTGLGLAMVSHIVVAHGGRLEMESEPGRGSTFTLRLPAAPAGHSDDAEPGRLDDSLHPTTEPSRAARGQRT